MAAEAFQETLSELGIDETDPELGDPRSLGRRGALLAVAGAVWGRHLGPSLNTRQVAELLGVGTRQAVHDRVKRHRILALPTGEREHAYPAFQFGETGQPYPVIGPVLEAFAVARLSSHTIASWFVTPQPLLDDSTPARWIAEGRDDDRLITAARRAAARTRRQVLAAPPAKLGNFPRRALRSTTELVRIHPNDLGPWWFSSGGHGRFDLAPPNGTCYVALSPLGAFVEVFRGFTIVDSADVADRALSRLYVPRDVVLADCTSPRARRFGVTGEIHSTADYTATQAWAEALRGAGFAGVRYFCGQDPSQREIGVALFGAAGEADWPVAETTPIAEQVLRAVERRFGIHVLPTP